MSKVHCIAVALFVHSDVMGLMDSVGTLEQLVVQRPSTGDLGCFLVADGSGRICARIPVPRDLTAQQSPNQECVDAQSSGSL